MKFTSTAFTLLSLLTLASAQSVCDKSASAVPSCGEPCILSAISANSNCAATDYACQCAPAASTAIQSAAQLCVLSACGVVTGFEVQASALAVCACASANGAISSATGAVGAKVSSAIASATAAVGSKVSAAVASATGSSGTSGSAAGLSVGDARLGVVSLGLVVLVGGLAVLL